MFLSEVQFRSVVSKLALSKVEGNQRLKHAGMTVFGKEFSLAQQAAEN